jgi:AcrR family transcriptional regulator
MAPPRANQPLRRRPGRPVGIPPGESQHALLRAARDLMAEKGLPRITLREVAERAGVQPALVSYYFGGKSFLLRAVVADVAERAI